MLDSGVGVPGGLIFSIQFEIEIEEEIGGLIIVDYATLNLKLSEEYFICVVNGVYLYETSISHNSSFIVPLQSGKSMISLNLESYDNTDLSGIESKAQVLISKIKVIGTTTGGADTCIACPNNTYSLGNQAKCSKCQPGYEANSEKTACQKC